MREAAGRIQDIANQLLTNHGKEEKPQEKNSLSPVMVSMALLSVISSKRMEYQHSPIKLHFEASSEAYFSFIEADIVEFKRMISNLINNAMEAFTRNSGEVRVTLHKNESQVIVSIIDTGCGLSAEKIHKILNDEKIDTQKKAGFGLGLAHAKQVLKKSNASLHIYSSALRGTTIELTFTLLLSPYWITNEIQIKPQDCIVVLDDDQSIHGAWGEIFSNILKEYSEIKLIHFTQGKECIEYISSHPSPENLLLLTDYELIGQAMNGLDVIEKTQVKRAVLVTSHYENQEVIKRASELKVKVLPKMLASQVKLIVNEPTKPTNENLIQVDLILLDDNKALSNAVSLAYEMKDKTLKVYNSPYALLEEISRYAKDTKICTDYTLNCAMTGLDVAKILHEQGFTNLYLATGHRFTQEDLPEYVRLLKSKDTILGL